MKLKAGIYDPYLDTLGGGERYCLTVAEILNSLGYEVDIFWSGDSDLISKAESRFNLNLQGIHFKPDIFKSNFHSIDVAQDPESLTKVSLHHHPSNNKIFDFIKKYKITSQYDIIFYLSDWSMPFLFAKKNILHIQVPFIINQTFKTKLFNKIKNHFLNNIVCNSKFTSNFAQKYFGNKCLVLYPPVDVKKFDANQPKENIILSVGRFDNILNSKKQEILIDAFKTLYKQNKNLDWKLVLAGGSLSTPEKNNYLQHLKYQSNGYPIEFAVNPNFDKLKNIYSTAKIYWHAAGYGVDESIHPENTEHFGMAPVEAMASGCVPIIVKRGGLGEIITDGQEGYLWNSQEDLIAKTQLLLHSPQTIIKMSKSAIDKSQFFSKEKFSDNLQQLLHLK